MEGNSACKNGIFKKGEAGCSPRSLGLEAWEAQDRRVALKAQTELQCHLVVRSLSGGALCRHAYSWRTSRFRIVGTSYNHPLAVCSLFSSSPGGSICRKEGSLESGEASRKETYSRVLT